MADLWHPIVLERGLSYSNMDDCMVVGMAGHCGLTCPVYMRGECPEPEGIAAAPTAQPPQEA